MNRKTFKFASRGVAALLLASVSAFALVLTHSSASSEQPIVNAPNQPTNVESKIGSLGAKTDAETPDAITLKAEKRGFPLINLLDGKKLGSELLAGAAAQSRVAGRPQTMLNADLNLDGASDLIVGYASSNGGHLLVYQGNPDSLSARAPESFEGIKEGRFPAPFLSSAKSVELSIAPDFIGAGDFNRDGYKDIIAAARGANSLVLLAGNANADFSLQTIELPGQVTALLAENIDPADGQPDVAVALSDSNGAWLFVFDNEHNVFAEQPRMYLLPAAATSLALGQLDDSAPMDILAAAGGKAVVIHGSYPEKNESPESQLKANAYQVETLNAGLDVAAVRVGHFVWDRENRPEIALLGASGTIQILQRGNIDRRQYSEEEWETYWTKREEQDQIELQRRSADPTNRAIAVQTNQKQQRQTAQKWTEADSFQLSSGLNLSGVSAASVFTSARMTTQGVDNLIVADSASRKIKVLLQNNDELKAAAGDSNELSATGALVAIDFETQAPPVAVLPMRLSVMTRPGLVMLDKDNAEVSYSVAAPVATYTVTKTADTADGACNADCSLREAFIAANATVNTPDIVSVPAGTYTLTIGPSDDAASGFGPAWEPAGDLDVRDDLTITGAGQATTIIQAGTSPSNGIDRVLHTRQRSFGIPDISISGVTIRNGKCDTSGSSNAGSARCNTGGAGLLHSVDDLGAITITDSTITSNWNVAGNNGASQFFLNGAGIFAGRGDTTLTNATISNNENGATGSLHGGEGGGLLFGFSSSTNINTVTMNNCTVTGNIARKIGSDTLGGNGGGFNGAYDVTNINGGTFSNNSADLDGGGIYNLTNTNISNITVTGNSAKRDGGGIWSDPFFYDAGTGGTTNAAFGPGTNTITNVTLRGNTADSDGTTNIAGDPRGAGGGIYHDRNTLNLSNVTIGGTGASEPNTSYDGGGLGHRYRAVNSTANLSTISINGGSIVGNVANNDGGGIFHDATRAAGSNSTLSVAPTTGVTLTSNKAKNNGGGVLNNGGASATLKDMQLRSNQANSDNSGGGDGGALYQDTAASTTTFTGTLSIGGSGFANSAVNGGGIRNNAGTVNIPSGASITHNTASGTGGGISNAGTLSALATPTITNNIATGNGGGIFNTGTLGAITTPTLNNNSALNGGGLFSSNGALSISNGTVTSNTSTAGNGGGIEHSGTSGSTITSVSITNNTGNGIHISGTGSLDAKINTITSNTGDGITKTGSGTGSHFDSNIIHSNGELGIDLGDNEVTANDAGDGDGGPNNLQNYPVLNYVRRGTGSAGIASITLNSAPGKYRIQYYANTACDASGHGEGEALLAATEEITVPVGGNLTYLSSVALPYGIREQITATATSNPNGDANYDDGSTSEFSACRKVNTLPTFTAVQTPSRQQGSPVSNSQIATVTDPDQTLNTLAVTVNGGASATVNGVTVSNIAVDASGNVTADVVASCNATNASFTLRVTDTATEYNETTLNVTVTPNTPPTVGNYSNTTVNAGSSGTVITPSAAPNDNGTVATLTAAAPGFTGTFAGNAGTGAVTVNSAGPAGVYTVTVTATDNCGATTTTTFQLTVNAIPTITGATLSRQQGSPSANSQIATVNDAEDAENTLVVTVNGAASATVNGVTVSNIAVDASGNVTADVVASCTATNATFTLTVTDSVGASSNATLTVNVTPNTSPTVGTYSTTNLSSGGGTTVTPSAGPADNGSIASASVTASGAFTGTLSVNSATGVVTISNANPGGSFTVSVTFTDNCGATKTEQFTLNVTYSISGTVSYGIIQINQTQKKVPDVLLSVTGTPTVSDTTDSMGFYQLDGLTAGGNYTVTPTKTTDVNGISPSDATQVLRHVASGGAGPNALTPDQQIAADTNGDGNISPFDATLILKYVVAMGPTAETGQVGTWKFVPPSTNYNPLSSSQSNQNYTAYLIGDVNGDWAPPSPLASNVEAEKQETALVTNERSSSVPAEAPAFVRDQQELISRSGKTKEPTATEVQLLLPTNSSSPNGSVVLIPVWLNNDSNKRISSFKFAVRFDPNVLQPEQTAIEATDSLIGNGFMVVSDTATAGRLGVAATSLNNAVSDSGALVYLRFRVVGTNNDSASALNFETTSQESGTFEDNFGNKVASVAANGSFAPFAPKNSAKR
jgi:CSLREA domain-containing protein